MGRALFIQTLPSLFMPWTTNIGRRLLAGADLGVGPPSGSNCSFFGGWRDQLEVRFCHDIRPPTVNDCSYK